jgi:tRNA dimethylallyltransferase
MGEDRSRAMEMRVETLVLGLRLNKEIAQKRIEQRIEKMLEKGFLDEVRTIGETYGWESEALTATGYRSFKEVVLGTKPVRDAVAEMVRGHMLLAKKQMTWFKRNGAIRWLEDLGEAEGLVRDFLKARV